MDVPITGETGWNRYDAPKSGNTVGFREPCRSSRKDLQRLETPLESIRRRSGSPSGPDPRPRGMGLGHPQGHIQSGGGSDGSDYDDGDRQRVDVG